MDTNSPNKDRESAEQLRIISQMIAQVKRKPSKVDSINALLWGYLVFVAATAHWSLAKLGFGQPYHVWWLMALGTVASVVINYRLAKEKRAKTYIDYVIVRLWLGFAAAFVVVFASLSPLHIFFVPCIMVLFALGMWVQGALIKFLPFSLGAACTWALAIWAAHASFADQLLILALAIMLGHLVPGHLLMLKARRGDV